MKHPIPWKWVWLTPKNASPYLQIKDDDGYTVPLTITSLNYEDAQELARRICAAVNKAERPPARGRVAGK